MGKAVKAISSPLGIVANPMIGLNALAGKKAASALGLSLDGEQGAYATPEQMQADLYRKFANDYDNQMGLAEKGVQESALTKDLFGQGGLQSQLATEGKDLASRGFSLQQPDHEAYGQVSGDVARLFGQQEADTTQALARRGLASAGSGAAGAAFSGLSGNKNEMLAQAQMQIAQKRMQDTQNRLMQNRQLQQSLGVHGNDMARKRYSDKGDSLLNATNVETASNNAKRQAAQDQADAYKPGLFESIGQGLQSGVTNLASAAPGMLVGGAMNGGGAAGGRSALGGSGNTVAGRTQPRTIFGNPSGSMIG